MSHDARVGVWMAALETTKLAGKFRKEFREGQQDGRITPSVTLPEDYWAMMAEAQVLARLSTAESGVGLLAGLCIDREVAAKKQAEALRENMMARVKKPKCTCEFGDCPVSGHPIDNDAEKGADDATG